ncbi:hypothetical protein ABAC460_18445 [Asticcacaulis sp. AC460]|uniref:Ig-like domain-containing protein n=1 Tax=Asticcacaulis sp. AC460 TaxID=1282360 RepID=UPI0003C3AEFC|nr:Ig-like domain-containing protein [Asticcacaulis sp. AC460]ESQ87656.1 hypothetical protein ABAC460_18445 [Asticcacaulis sp. AC460]
MSKAWISAFTGALAAMALIAGLAYANTSLQVQVRDAAGNPVANATVCAGTSSARASRGFGHTNANGVAVLNVADSSGPLVITAHSGTRGGQQSIPGSLTLATVTLPASGGPVCPDGTPTPTPGTVTIDRRAVQERADELARQPHPGVLGPINLNGERCFGAAGQGCSDTIGGVGTCIGGSCTINAGSWEHDECCVRNRDGGMCDGKFEEMAAVVGAGGPPQVCQAQFNKAFARVGTLLSWRRAVNFNTVNTTGNVDFAAYCAPAGTLMPAGEAGRFCCSRQARDLTGTEAGAVSLTNLRQLAGDTIRVCR